MKKVKKVSVLLLVIMCVCSIFCACGQKSDGSEASEVNVSEAIIGDWALTAIQDADGNAYTLEEYCETQGVDSEGVKASYTFADDGSVVGAIGGIGVEGTYEVSDISVNCTFDGQESTMTYNADSNTLTCEDAASGMTSVLEK